jgi:ABC-2 type transport system permease protein
VAALFLQLKLTLLRNRFRQSGSAVAQLIVGIVVVLFFAGSIVMALLATRFSGHNATNILVVLQVLQALGWAVSPLLAFGVDETLDPSRFALLPLTRRVLVRGLFVAALVGVLPIGNLIALLGGAVAVADPWWTLVIAVPAALLQLVLCVLLARAMAAGMSGLLRSRRGRDLAVLVGAVAILLPQVLNVVINGAVRGRLDPFAVLETAAAPLRWLPPGALAHAASDAATGQWGLLVIDFLLGGVAIGLLAWWWRVALSRSLVRPDRSMERVERAGAVSGLVQRLIPGLPGLVAARDLRLVGRDPMRRMSWLVAIAVGVIVPLVPLASGSGSLGGAYGAWLLVLMCGLQTANQYGYDGSGVWQHVVALGGRRQARAEVLGHVTAVVLPSLPLVLVGSVAFPLIAGEPELIPAAVGLMLALFGGALAGGCLSSAWVPYGMPQSRTSAFASSVPGQGGVAFLAMLATAAVAGVTILPSVILVVLAASMPAFAWLALVVGAVCGVGAVAVGVRLTGDRFTTHATSILATVSSGDRV